MEKENCNICKGKGLVMDGASSTTTCDTCGGTGLSAAHRKQKDCSQSALNELLDPLFPTREDIEQMARSNPVLCRVINIGAMQRLNWVETMHLAVKCLVEYSDDREKTLLKIVELSGQPLVIKERD